MKQYILISAAALLALAACTKVTGDGTGTQREIAFAVANYATKANVEYDKEANFGSYAWFNDGSGTAQVFMTNEIVGFADGVWKTVERPFFWPKTGNLDFICYSPFAGTNGVAPNRDSAAPAETGTAGNGQTAAQEETPSAPEPVITREQPENGKPYYTFEYLNYRATGSQYDLMYADLAGAQTAESKKDTYTSISGVNGVPTLFHHALARVSFRIKANFVEWTEGEDVTKWEIKLQDARLYFVRHTGSFLMQTNSNGMWIIPGNDEGCSWISDPASEKSITLYELNENETEEVPGQLITDTEYYTLLEEQYVLPQTLDRGAQGNAPTLYMKFFITTTLSSGKQITEVYEPWLPLKDQLPEDMAKVWEKNQRFLYTINLKPTAKGNPDNPDDPTDVTILFEPETEDWEVVKPVLEIEL